MFCTIKNKEIIFFIKSDVIDLKRENRKISRFSSSDLFTNLTHTNKKHILLVPGCSFYLSSRLGNSTNSNCYLQHTKECDSGRKHIGSNDIDSPRNQQLIGLRVHQKSPKYNDQSRSECSGHELSGSRQGRQAAHDYTTFVYGSVYRRPPERRPSVSESNETNE